MAEKVFEHRDVYNYILTYKQQNNGNSPSMREIAEALGMGSVNTSHKYVHELAEDGRITFSGTRQISIPGWEYVREIGRGR